MGVLSGGAGGWREAVGRWSAGKARHKTDGMPDSNTEYFFYQTLVGAWPLSAERASAYMLKAAREAKTRTSWTAPVEHFERALETFVRSVLEDGELVRDLEAFAGP